MMPILRVTLAGSLALSLATGLTLAQTKPTPVKDVAVEVDLSAISNPAAAAFWTDIADDLENAIIARIADRVADDGVRVSVDVSEVELANAFENITNTADTRMSGQVNITSDTDNSAFNSYELTVTVEETLPYFPAGTTITMIQRGTPEYYRAMVEAFADAVVNRL